MSDVRAMLRAERANRGPEPVGKKRKAVGISTSSPAESRKRVKSDDERSKAAIEPVKDVVEKEDTIASEAVLVALPVEQSSPDPQPQDPTPDDLLAFDRELAELEASHKASTTTFAPPSYTGATISAAPLTAEQLAAQAREEQSAQRGKRDEEIEAEKEDAEDNLREEMEEMKGLEERVRRLRERREAVRVGKEGGEVGDGVGTKVVGQSNGVSGGEDEEDDEEEEEDEWRFGGS